MTQHITTWRPDTCECEVQYSWDDSVPAEERVHSLHKVVKACAEHPADAHEVGTDMSQVHVHQKNTHKNFSIKKLGDALGITDSKEVADIAWRHEDGKLVLTVPEEHKSNKQLAEAAVAADGVLVE